MSDTSDDICSGLGLQKTFAEIAASLDKDALSLVKGRRPTRNKNPRGQNNQHQIIRGTASSRNDNISGVRHTPKQKQQVKGGVFVSRLCPSANCSDLENFIYELSSEGVKCFQLKSRHDSYKSFRVCSSPSLTHKLLEASVWPQNVVIRQYFN